MCLELPCGYSLQTLCKISGFLQLITSLLIVGFFGFLLLVNENGKKDDLATYLEENEIFQIMIGILLSILALNSIIFNVIFINGVERRNLKNIRIWFFYSLANIGLVSIIFILLIAFISRKRKVDLSIIFIFFLSVYTFFISVGYTFKKKLQEEEHYGKLVRIRHYI